MSQSDKVFGFVINEMEEKLEKAIFDYDAKKKILEYKTKSADEKNEKIDKDTTKIKEKQEKTDEKLKNLEEKALLISKEFDEIQNLINQRPIQSENNQWSYQTLSGIANELLNQIQNEKKKQKELYQDLSKITSDHDLEQKIDVKLLHYPKYDESSSKTTLYLFNDLIVITKKSTKRVAIFYSNIKNVSFIRNLPTFDSVTFCTNISTSHKKGSLEEFCSIRFETPTIRDALLKRISTKFETKETDDEFYIKDVGMSYLPPILSGHQTSPIGNNIYSFGGQQSPKDVIGFDLNKGIIQYYKALLPPLEGHSVISNGEDIYISGGQSNNKFREETWKWNCKENNIETKHNKLNSKTILISKNGFSSRINQSMNIWDDKLIIFGGKGSGPTTYYNDITIFDTRNIQEGWTNYSELENKPQGRSGHTSIIYKDQMIIYGGKNEKTIFSDVYILDLQELKWRQANLQGDELPSRAFHQSVIIYGSQYMFSFGGNEDSNTGHLINLETYEVKSVKIKGNVIPTLTSFSLSSTQNGNLILIGGKSKDHPTNLVQYIEVPEIYKSQKERMNGDNDSLDANVIDVDPPIADEKDIKYLDDFSIQNPDKDNKDISKFTEQPNETLDIKERKIKQKHVVNHVLRILTISAFILIALLIVQNLL